MATYGETMSCAPLLADQPARPNTLVLPEAGSGAGARGPAAYPGGDGDIRLNDDKERVDTIETPSGPQRLNTVNESGL